MPPAPPARYLLTGHPQDEKRKPLPPMTMVGYMMARGHEGGTYHVQPLDDRYVSGYSLGHTLPVMLVSEVLF